MGPFRSFSPFRFLASKHFAGSLRSPAFAGGLLMYIQLRISLSVSSSLLILMGLAIWPFIPTRRASCLSSSKALAVMARMGMSRSPAVSRDRMALAVS